MRASKSMNSRGVVPNFFVVGAPKCGTTSLCDYLGQHPEIFIPEKKEPMYFCRDEGHREPWMVTSLDGYLSLFTNATGARAIGEGSVWYLESRKAAARIKQFNPDSKIIIMLRDPTDMLISLHGQFLFSGNESVREFAEAYALSERRSRGKSIPKGAHFPAGLCYAEVARYEPKVRRYLETFGSDRVKVIVFEEFVADLARGYREVLQFLGVDDRFVANFTVLNERRYIRNVLLQRLLWKSRSVWDFDWIPARTLRQRLRWRVKQLVWQPLLEWNVVEKRRSSVPLETRELLAQDCRKDVEALEKLLQRSLDVWK